MRTPPSFALLLALAAAPGAGGCRPRAARDGLAPAHVASEAPAAAVPQTLAPAEEACHPDAPGCAAARGVGAPQAEEASLGCERDPRVTAFSRDVVLVGAAHRIHIVGTQGPGADGPGHEAPQSGINTLFARLVGSHGQPVSGARVTLTATMPDHAHGGSRVLGQGGGATQRFAGVDLMMPGVWLLTFDIEGGGGPPDRASVHLCVPG